MVGAAEQDHELLCALVLTGVMQRKRKTRTSENTALVLRDALQSSSDIWPVSPSCGLLGSVQFSD